uniref:CAP-Gly domain-containing protein n=1 Tax=Sinocyclocheilus rhinocerous TaxID=307959 RepID=A0A673ISR2_9TELE
MSAHKKTRSALRQPVKWAAVCECACFVNLSLLCGSRLFCKVGTLWFCGSTEFAGFWLGIDLDKPSGKNDGSVGGVRYFSCPPKHGVFAPPSRVQRQVCLLISGVFTNSRCESPYLATCHFTSMSTSRANSSAGPGPNRVGGTTSSSGSDGTVKLHLGMQVLLISANEMGTIRYIGTADFAPGLWLGLELRSPKGKNYGSVGSRRYFSCRPGHGVLVRPTAENNSCRNKGFPSLHPSGFRLILLPWVCCDISANPRRHFLSNCTNAHMLTADKLFT